MLPPIEIFYTVIGAISLLVYISLLTSLVYFRLRREKDYQSSFFVIFISLGVGDICQRVSTQFSQLLLFDPSLRTFYLTVGNDNQHIMAKFGIFGLFFFGYVQCSGHLLVSINRYTAMSFPFRHDELWSTRRLTFAIAMQWTISFLLTVHVFFIESTFFAEYDYVALLIDYEVSPMASEVSNVLSSSITFVIIMASLILNLLAFYNYRKTIQNHQFLKPIAQQTTTQQPSNNNKHQIRFERQLFIYGFVVFFITVPTAIAQMLTAIAILSNNYTLLSAINPNWQWINELICDANPYILLFTSGMLRKRIWKMVNAEATSTVSTIAIINK